MVFQRCGYHWHSNQSAKRFKGKKLLESIEKQAVERGE